MEGGEELEMEQTTIRLPKELKKELQKQADKMDISFNAMLMMLIDIGYQHL